MPKGHLPVPPDLVFEVLSPEDRWNKIREKVSEYLDIGVRAIGVLDPSAETVHLYRPDLPERILSADENLSLPEILGEFRVRVGQFFE